MISTPINQGNSKPPCLCDHQLVTGLVLRVRSTIWYDKSEAWRFSVDEIVGKFKSRSWTKLEFAKNRPKSSLFFLKSCFLSLNVKFPRFLVQMSKWCYRSQCSWFCFLFSISRAVPRLDFYLIPYQYCMSHTQWSCVKKNNRRGVLSLSRALLGQLNSSKPGEAIVLQITGSLTDHKVSVFTNKSVLH